MGRPKVPKPPVSLSVPLLVSLEETYLLKIEVSKEVALAVESGKLQVAIFDKDENDDIDKQETE